MENRKRKVKWFCKFGNKIYKLKKNILKCTLISNYSITRIR